MNLLLKCLVIMLATFAFLFLLAGMIGLLVGMACLEAYSVDWDAIWLTYGIGGFFMYVAMVLQKYREEQC